MSRYRSIPLSLAVATLVLAAPVHAQGRSAVTSAELDAAVTTGATGQREAVRDFLANPQVERVAARMGVNTTRLSANVAKLDQAALNRIATQSGVNDLAGGDQKVIISTTVIIIALLVLILLTR